MKFYPPDPAILQEDITRFVICCFVDDVGNLTEILFFLFAILSTLILLVTSDTVVTFVYQMFIHLHCVYNSIF